MPVWCRDNHSGFVCCTFCFVAKPQSKAYAKLWSCFSCCSLSSDRETPCTVTLEKKRKSSPLLRYSLPVRDLVMGGMKAKCKLTCICRFICSGLKFLIRLLNKSRHTAESMIPLAHIKRCWLPALPSVWVFVIDCRFLRLPSAPVTALWGASMSAH